MSNQAIVLAPGIPIRFPQPGKSYQNRAGQRQNAPIPPFHQSEATKKFIEKM
jgi:hypothetical protein